MRKVPAASIFIAIAFLAAPSIARAETDKVMVCHKAGKGKGGVSKLIPLPALGGHLTHGDCRLDASHPAGAACDGSDPDADGLCDVACDPASQTCVPNACGDGAGPGGTDLRCSCGDTVVTNTTLDFAVDPVTNTVCAADGLTLSTGVRLDLNGNTLVGSGNGNGLSLPNGGAVQGGTVSGFGVGMRIGPGAAGSSTTVSGTTIQNNAGDGVLVDVADSQSRVVLSAVTVQSNGDDGIHVRGAPGLSNLDDVAQRLPRADYGFRLEDGAVIANNAGHGIHLGDSVQVGDVAAMIGGIDLANSIQGNAGAGILMEQEPGLLPGADCGASAGQPGCTGATMMNNLIRDNASTGVELRSGFIVPFYVPGSIEAGLGFLKNEISHNAMTGPGCNVVQTAPQVFVSGPVGLSNATCGTAATPEACESLNTAADNQHCIWHFGCFVAWDLRGDVEPNCPNDFRNAIYGYNVSDTANNVSVGIRAINNASVWAEHNEWQHVTASQNVTSGDSSFVQAELACGTRSCSP